MQYISITPEGKNHINYIYCIQTSGVVNNNYVIVIN